jgi:glycosyltransferase involved in cell wall biosynthesis
LPVGDAGGAQTVAAALAMGLHADGVRAHVAGLVGPSASHPWLEQLAASGVPVHAISAQPRDYRGEARQLAALAVHIGAGVVHSHVYRADFVAWRAKQAAWAHVITAHGFTGGHWRNRAYEAFGRWLMARADATIAVSHPLADRLRRAGVSSRRLHTVPNVLQPPEALPRADARARLGLEASATAVGFIGRFGHEKGADQLLDAVRWLPPHTTVVLIGDGPERMALEAQASALGPTRVRFAGMVPDAARLVRAFDAICLPSRTEGTPMVLLEALAAGVPAVAFGVGGIPDVLASAPEWLAPAGDTRALADRLTRVLAHVTEARETAQRIVAARAATHDPAEWIAQHRRIYAAVTPR